MTTDRHGSSVTEFPSELEIVTTRKFDAPIELVFDVLTEPEHVRSWFAPFEDRVTTCEIDLRVGGDYHIVFVTPDGKECSFRGTYLEIERPTRTVETWWFEGWGPDTDAVETVELHEDDGVTTLTMKLAFRNEAGRSRMTSGDGQEDSFDKLEDYLRSLAELGATPTRSSPAASTSRRARRGSRPGSR
ncbi:MAG TPA: SRPBCC domain-containing protein [Gaiellaceae bacterium]|nr:SRPBCC domain-containing protein [Gaiellaceae bacterium]